MTDPYIQEMIKLKRKSKDDDALIIKLKQEVINIRHLVSALYRKQKAQENTDGT